MSVFLITAVRNEERYLPGLLSHIAPYVDGIVALDDCPTDATPAILKREPKIASVLREDRGSAAHAHEASNRYRLTCEAARLGARWVVCADADERFEEAFLRRLPEECARAERTGHAIREFRLVNLWTSPALFRLDGSCGPRWAPRMFRIPPKISARPAKMHQPWFPPELDGAPRMRVNAYLYHLRMIDAPDRRARFEKFRAIDPQNRHQPVGYGHLIDERDLKLAPVRPWRGYSDPRDQPVKPMPAAEEFDELFYLNENVDVGYAVLRGRCVSGWQHFRERGHSEGRIWRRKAHLKGLDFGAIFATRRGSIS